MRQNCPYCDPYPCDHRHRAEKIAGFFSGFFYPLKALENFFEKFPGFNSALAKIVFGGFFKISLRLKLLKETAVGNDEKEIYNRTLVVIKEAQKRNIPVKAIKFGNNYTNFFSMEINRRKEFFEGLPHLTAEHIFEINFDDKGNLKKLLKNAGLPHPRGAVFNNYGAACRFIQKTTGWPAVVKPRSGSLSKHAICNIKNENELKEAVKAVQIISKEFIAEEFIPGDIYRIVVVNGKVAAGCRREPPNITGDGKRTIKELVEIKNQNPQRGAIGQKNSTLHKITLTEKSFALLSEQNFCENNIPPRGKKVYLHEKVILASGADTHDITDAIHQENRFLFEKLAQLCHAAVIGIDFIASDISKPPGEQRCAVIEANSMPYIDMHHYPSFGKERNVAGAIIDYCLLRQKQKARQCI